MKKTLMASATAVGLAAMLAAGSAAAKDQAGERVWIGFNEGQQQSLSRILQREGAQVHFEFNELGAMVATLPRESIRRLSDSPAVRFIEPDLRRYPMSQTTPYGIDLVQARDVWDSNRDGQLDPGAPTGEGITVCVIDSGLTASHENFEDVEVIGGHPAGWDNDRCGHGTHVAGTVAAANDGRGVVGVSPGGVSLFIVKVFGNSTNDSCQWTYSSSLVDAATRCANAGAKVINMSLGGGGSSTAEGNAFQNLQDNGVLSIAAAGNSGNSSLSYPASYDSVVSIAAVDQNANRASFSQFNSQVELAAPGVGTLSTLGFAASAFQVAGQTYGTNVLTNSVQTSVSGDLIEAGLCLDPLGAEAAGKIVLCQRGEIPFADKALNAQAGGAVGVAIYNNEPGNFSGTFGTTSVAIPGISLSQADGQALVADSLGLSAMLSTTYTYPTSGYGNMSGTSMASPHAAGAAAVLWSAKPEMTAAEVRAVLGATAQDRGTPGRNHQYGHGLIQLKDAVDYVLDGNEPPPPPPPPPPPAIEELANGETVFIEHIASGEFDRYFIDVPAGASDLVVNLAETASTGGDADLYVRFGAEPTTTDWDCRPYDIGSDETCSFEAPQEGRYYVFVRAFPFDGDVADVELTASFQGGGGGDAGPEGLVVTTSGMRGRATHTLSWEGGADQVDVHRNGSVVHSGANTGGFQATAPAARGPFTYMVCDHDTDDCSEPVTVN